MEAIKNTEKIVFGLKKEEKCLILEVLDKKEVFILLKKRSQNINKFIDRKNRLFYNCKKVLFMKKEIWFRQK